MATLKKIGILFFAKLLCVIMVIIGLICGVLYSFGGFVIDALVTLELISSAETPGLSYGTVLAFGALIGMPVIFGIFGFFAGVIGAILYNLFARLFGGIEMDFKK